MGHLQAKEKKRFVAKNMQRKETTGFMDAQQLTIHKKEKEKAENREGFLTPAPPRAGANGANNSNNNYQNKYLKAKIQSDLRG